MGLLPKPSIHSFSSLLYIFCLESISSMIGVIFERPQKIDVIFFAARYRQAENTQGLGKQRYISQSYLKGHT